MNKQEMRELEEGLLEVTTLLNKRRGLYNKYIAGQEYFLESSEPNEFKILTKYHKKKNRGICAEVKVEDKGLSGIIVPIKSTKPVIDFLHAFAHKHDISLGSLGCALSFNYFP